MTSVENGVLNALDEIKLQNNKYHKLVTQQDYLIDLVQESRNKLRELEPIKQY